MTQAGELPPLLRPPLGRQHEAITATAASLRTHRNTLFVADMGCGKSVIAIVSAVTAGMKRILVMCPPHLVEKWAREVKMTLPNARTRILESISDVDALKGDHDPTPLFVIISREKAKLGHAWRPAYVLKEQAHRDDKRNLYHLSIPTCGVCGATLETDAGLLTHEDLAKKKHTCPCGSPLWQADEGSIRRYPLAHYITKKLKGFFDLLVLDEMHELKAKGSAQGIAAGALAESIPRSLGLTGTLFGGYASNLFYLLYRFSPQIREHYAYDDDTRFVQHYGVLERITRESYNEDGRVSRRKGRSTTTKERPGLSPAVLPHLLHNTVFLRLPDVAAALPPYSEEVEAMRMNEMQRETHLSFRRDLTAEVQRQLACGSKKLLGAYLQSLMHHPDTPWREESVTTIEADGSAYVVAHAPPLDDTVHYPKEKRLLEIVRQEKARGRKVLVFVQGTDKRDITPRLKGLLEEEGIQTSVLKSHTVSAKNRERWVQKEVKSGLDALICHPRSVQTGLDLLDFPTIVFYQVEFSVFVRREVA